MVGVHVDQAWGDEFPMRLNDGNITAVFNSASRWRYIHHDPPREAHVDAAGQPRLAIEERRVLQDHVADLTIDFIPSWIFT